MDVGSVHGSGDMVGMERKTDLHTGELEQGRRVLIKFGFEKQRG